MRLLLDTHTLIWFYLDDPQLSAAARLLIEDAADTKLVSPASYWELAIKFGLGKYTLTESYGDFAFVARTISSVYLGTTRRTPGRLGSSFARSSHPNQFREFAAGSKERLQRKVE